MSDATVTFPAGFEHLARHADWVLPTERERVEARLSRPYSETAAFYNELIGELDAILAHLLTRPADDVTAEDAALTALACSLMEVSDAVEIYEQGAVPDGADLRQFVSVLDSPVATPTRGRADG